MLAFSTEKTGLYVLCIRQVIDDAGERVAHKGDDIAHLGIGLR